MNPSQLWLFCLSLFFSSLSFATPEPRKDFQWDTIKLVAIQDRGRIKPLETFANETVQYVTGKPHWKGLNSVEVVFGWLIAFDKEWEEEPFIRIDHGPLKKALGLETSRKFFSPKELEQNAELPKIVRDAMQKEQRKERQSELEKKANQLQNQRGLVDFVMSGRAWSLLPNPKGVTQDWFSLAELGEKSKPIPYEPQAGEKLTTAIRELLTSFMDRNASGWNSATIAFSQSLRDVSEGAYPPVATLQQESHYNNLHPFRWAWIFYTVAFVALLTFNVMGAVWGKYAGLGAILIGIGYHTYGFVLRCLIAGRPPVTNMYESVIWVTWGCVLFALVIWWAYQNAIILTASTVFSIVGLVLADNVPLALDPSIQPLEPVLRSNYWLTIHVLTITLSYAAFALSLCLGNVVLGNYLFRPKEVTTIQNFSLYMYRAMQIGVVLLAAGTILGGVWADYSWGRFWGWDPKEVWALIALLLYLAVLHGRFTGWLRGFGFAATTVVSFLGVLMAWYGVNFVLGVGLHSYGFGSGGMGYVGLYIALQVGFIILAYVRYSKVRASRESEPQIFPRGV